MEVAVGQQWGIFSRTVHRWAVATVISVDNGTVNLKYRDYPGFCHLAAVDMLRSNDDLQFLQPLEEITPRQWQD
jgi:hypothetical protein